ncbi:hypothetical protein VTG60DRAFT_6011 [Thermothelomyces hinnuleus]
MRLPRNTLRTLVLTISFLALAAALPPSVNPGEGYYFPGRLRGRAPGVRRTVVGGHGVVILPGDAPPEAERDGTARVRIGGASYRVASGVNTVIDGVPIEDYTPVGEEE